MFKQPRIPQRGANIPAYLDELARFLRDFCMEAWSANERRRKEIRELQKQIDQMKGR